MVPNPPLYYIDSNIIERETLKNEVKSEIFSNSKQIDANISYSKVEIKTKIKASESHKFIVEGWPESKSRFAEDYVNYVEPTEILIPNSKPFSSWNAGNRYSIFLINRSKP